MKILEAGHVYELNALDKTTNPDLTTVLLYFVKRTGPGYPGNNNAHTGTTSQEALRALLDRAKYVNYQQWCWQTWLSIPLLRFIIWLYEHRAARRHKRKVPRYRGIEHAGFCERCGHVGCEGGCHAALYQ